MAQERGIKTVYPEISARKSPFVCQVSDTVSRGRCQARREGVAEREMSAETHTCPIHPDRQHSSLHVNLNVAIVSFMRASGCWHKLHGICAWLDVRTR